MRRRTWHGRGGFTLIELLIVVAILGILAAMAIANFQGARRRAQYTRAASDTKTTVTQAIVYQNDYSVFPGTIANLRARGYVSVKDKDPWGFDWLTTTIFNTTTFPLPVGELHVCSRGPTNAAPDCDTADLSGMPVSGTLDGGTGYSAIYGSWQGI